MDFPFNREGVLHSALLLKVGMMSDNDIYGSFLHIANSPVCTGAGVVKRCSVIDDEVKIVIAFIGICSVCERAEQDDLQGMDCCDKAICYLQYVFARGLVADSGQRLYTGYGEAPPFSVLSLLYRISWELSRGIAGRMGCGIIQAGSSKEV